MPQRSTRPEIHFGVILPPRPKKQRRGRPHSVERLVRVLSELEADFVDLAEKNEKFADECARIDGTGLSRKYNLGVAQAFKIAAGSVRLRMPKQPKPEQDQPR